MDKSISIAGVPVILVPIAREGLKGLNLDTILMFRFYKTVFNQHELCIAEPTSDAAPLTPKRSRDIAERIERAIGMPVAFLLPSLPYYERSRLVTHGVYFVVSDKYVFLPGMLINAQTKRQGKERKKLSATAQYILLYYLLHKEINEFTLQEIETKIPYSYQLISRAAVELEDKQLFQSEKDWKTKLMSSDMSREMLWEKAQPFLTSPIKKVVYTDDLWSAPFYIGGVSALSHYSNLNPDEQQTRVIWNKDYDKKKDAELAKNDPDSNYRIEIWKYSPKMLPQQHKYVDRLSLYLSLRDDTDPRINKELDITLNEIWQ